MKYQRYILNRFTRLTTTLFIIVALFSFCSLRQATAGWQIEVVDPRAGLLEGDTSLAFDLSGNPAISYGVFFSVTVGGELKYAHFNGATWVITSVIRAGPLVGINNSLAFDLSGNPAISFSGGLRNVGLALARFDGTTWNSTLVDPANLRSGKDSLAFDLSGNPAIAYSTGDIKFAHFNGTSWDITTVDSARGGATSLAFDLSGNPATSYLDTNFDLKFARFNSTSWDITTVDSTGDVGIFNSLAFDTSGNPAISYFDETNSDLKFARFNGTTWDITTVDSAGDVGRFNSLAFDPLSGNPAISYFDFTNGDLKFASFNGTSLVITIVDSTGVVGSDTSLAFDATSNPAISYHGFTNSNLPDLTLKFARFVPVTTTTSSTTTTTTITATTTTTFVCQCPASGNEGCISGTVTEVGTEEPLLGKLVILKRLFPKRPVVRERVQTDDEGCYLFAELEDGIYKIKVRRCRGGGRKTVVVVDGLLRNDVNFECR